MITIQHQGLHNNIAGAVEQAKALARSILVSHCVRLASNDIDPISFYARGKKQLGHRVYWSDPNGQLNLVGIGEAYTFDSNGKNDFKQIDKEWNELLRYSVLEPNDQVAGAGPVLLCAFSFDPEKSKTPLWANFPVAKVMLPRHLLTIKDNETWLTVNTIVHPNTNIQKLADVLLEEQNELLVQHEDLDVLSYSNAPQAITEMNKAEWLAAVEEIATEIQGNAAIEKVVLAREIRVKNKDGIPFSTAAILKKLKKQQQTSYIFAVESGPDCFIGASPERLIKKEGSHAYTTCLAGSIARGESTAEDEMLGQELLADEKNRHEHEVVVKVIKEAFEQCCANVIISNEPKLYKARDIQHLFTPVIAEVKQGVTLLNLVEKLHPTPALGGYPRELALQKIRELETMDRGLYAGPVGWLDSNGDGEFAVAIRSGLIQENEASLFAGCGLVGDSKPLSEYRETEIKFRPMLSALSEE